MSEPVERLLHGVGSPLKQSFSRDVAGPLFKADQTRGTSLALTLLTYMDHGHNARAAARVLGVHVNTLHNRLETIQGLMPGWSLPGKSLEVHLALRLQPEVFEAARRLNQLTAPPQGPGPADAG